MEWIISKGQMADAESIAHFQLDMAEESEGTTLDFQTVLDGVTSAMNDESKGIYLIARNTDNAPVGSLLLTKEWSDWTCTWYWWIQSVYVKPEYRRKGVYTALYNKVKALAKENGVRCVRLYVDRHNEKGLKTYSSLGMHESHYLMYEEEL